MRILTLLLLLLSAFPAWAGKHAFVLGNARYTQLDPLRNTIDDAAAYAEAFRDLGYKVTERSDLDLDGMLLEFETFSASIAPGDEVVFVFSGHGWSDGQINYLIPVDAPNQGSDRQLARSSIALKNGFDGVLDDLEASGAQLTVAIIDACRNNPFKPRAGRKSVGMTRGLAPVTAPSGSFVIFSAGEGQEALDRLPGDARNEKLSVFTRTFLPHLKSGIFLEDAISKAQVETAALARKAGGHRQHPAYYDQTLGDTCLTGNCATTPVVQTLGRCDKLFDFATANPACHSYEAYAETCADHTMAPIAKAYMRRHCQVEVAKVEEPKTEDKKVVLPVEPETQVQRVGQPKLRNFAFSVVRDAPDFSAKSMGTRNGAVRVYSTNLVGWYELSNNPGLYIHAKRAEIVRTAVQQPVAQGPQKRNLPMTAVRSAPRNSAKVIKFVGGELEFEPSGTAGWYKLTGASQHYIRLD